MNALNRLQSTVVATVSLLSLAATAIDATPSPPTRVTFDPYGHVATTQSPTGATRTTERNALGDEVAIWIDGDAVVDDAVFEATGQLRQYTYPAIHGQPERVADFAYDGLDRPWSLSLRALGIHGFDYYTDDTRYDERGFVTSTRRSDLSVGTAAVEYGYTDQEQLSFFRWNGAEIGYTYDERGNLTSRTGALGVDAVGVPGLLGYDPGNRRAGWSYDGRGRLTRDDRYRYDYDANGRIRLIHDLETGLWVAHYLYDAAGRRVRVLEPDGVTYTYRDSDGAVLAEELRDRAHELAETREHVLFHGRSVRVDTRSAAGERTEELRFVDRLGNPAFTWSAAGSRSYEYAPFGQTLDVGAGRRHSGAHGFTGHEDDAATGLVYMQARFYDPEASRFHRPDPARDVTPHLPATYNLYQYARNNPVNRIDDDGRQSDDANQRWLDYYKEVSKSLNLFEKIFKRGGEKYQIYRAVRQLNKDRKRAEDLVQDIGSAFNVHQAKPGQWSKLADQAAELLDLPPEMADAIGKVGHVFAQVAKRDQPSQDELKAAGDAIGEVLQPLLDAYAKNNLGGTTPEQRNFFLKLGEALNK